MAGAGSLIAPYPPAMSGRVDLHLRIRVKREKRGAFDAFLSEAIPFYEAPGGIRVRLVQEEQDSSRLIEIVEYASEEAYKQDQKRVESDPTMKAYLGRWRDLLDGPPEVLVYHEQPTELRGPNAGTPRPRLQTARVRLRPFEAADAPEVARLASDRRISSMTLFVPHPYELHHAQDWIARHDELWISDNEAIFAVCLRDQDSPGTLVGAIGLSIERAHQRAELGYWIGVPYWGQGFATEASRALIDFGFESLGLQRIHSCHFGTNPASGRVLVKAGLRPEGTARKHLVKWGEPQDQVRYGLCRDEWEQAKADGKEA
jgi:[ribosomal protein S5]-alanine N-acetyltransferase